jgi:hypothetical protein
MKIQLNDLWHIHLKNPCSIQGRGRKEGRNKRKQKEPTPCFYSPSGQNNHNNNNKKGFKRCVGMMNVNLSPRGAIYLLEDKYTGPNIYINLPFS